MRILKPGDEATLLTALDVIANTQVVQGSVYGICMMLTRTLRRALKCSNFVVCFSTSTIWCNVRLPPLHYHMGPENNVQRFQLLKKDLLKINREARLAFAHESKDNSSSSAPSDSSCRQYLITLVSFAF